MNSEAVKGVADSPRPSGCASNCILCDAYDLAVEVAALQGQPLSPALKEQMARALLEAAAAGERNPLVLADVGTPHHPPSFRAFAPREIWKAAAPNPRNSAPQRTFCGF